MVDEQSTPSRAISKKPPKLNESSDLSHMKKEQVSATDGDLKYGGTKPSTVINDGSELHLSTGKLMASQSAHKVQLPQIKSLNQMKVAGAFSSSNLKASSKYIIN